MDFNTNPNQQQFGYQETYSSMGSDYEASNPFVKDESSILSRVFGLMTMGLGTSAICALVGYRFFALELMRFYIPLVILELALVLFFSFRLNKMSTKAAKICFFAYSIVNGLTLSSLFLYYTLSSIYGTFFVAAGTFGIAALYGKITKKDLGGIGTYLMMGLVGIILASVVNLFLHNSMLDFGITIVGLIIFIALTAYDVNKVKNLAGGLEYQEQDSIEKISIYFALQLYLDFINIFLKLLSLLGKRKN